MASDIFRALKKLKTPYGYAETSDVQKDPPPLHDVMQSFFVSETLMYLYLTFAPEGTIDLSKQVFTTEGHPLPRSPVKAAAHLTPLTSTREKKLGRGTPAKKLATYTPHEDAEYASILD